MDVNRLNGVSLAAMEQVHRHIACGSRHLQAYALNLGRDTHSPDRGNLEAYNLLSLAGNVVDTTSTVKERPALQQSLALFQQALLREERLHYLRDGLLRHAEQVVGKHIVRLPRLCAWAVEVIRIIPIES